MPRCRWLLEPTKCFESCRLMLGAVGPTAEYNYWYDATNRLFCLSLHYSLHSEWIHGGDQSSPSVTVMGQCLYPPLSVIGQCLYLWERFRCRFLNVSAYFVRYLPRYLPFHGSLYDGFCKVSWSCYMAIAPPLSGGLGVLLIDVVWAGQRHMSHQQTKQS